MGKKGIAWIILAVMCVLLASGAMAETWQEQLDARVNRILRANKTTGAAVIVAKGGEIVYENYYGYAVKKGQEPITESTYFRLASVTKMVSAIRVMQLVEEGKLALDEDISTYLGYTVRNPYASKTKITLRMLMTHTSSLDPHGGYSRESNGLRSLISTDKRKTGNWYDETPGSKYRYSNFGAGIMGSLMESVTGENVDDVVRAGVFVPMGISASYSAGLLPDPENVASLYNSDGTMSVSRQRSIDKAWDSGVNPDMHYRITVGSLWMRPRDLCRLGMLLCNGGTLDGITLLQEETVAEMMAEQQGKNGITANTPYGLCVHHETTLVKGKTLYGHQGISDGILTNIYFDPETGFVFVFASNGCPNAMDNRVGFLTRKVFAEVWKDLGE